MRSALRTLLATLAVALVLHTGQANALEVFGNNGNTLGATGGNISGASGSNAYSLGQGFRTGGTTLELTSIQMAFNFQNPIDTGFTADQYLRIRLYSSIDNGSGLQIPDTTSPLLTFNTTPVGGTFTYDTAVLYAFEYTGTRFNLQANTNYWAVATFQSVDFPNAGQSPSYLWSFSDNLDNKQPSAGTSGSGYTYVGTVGQLVSGGSGGAWLNYNQETPTRRMFSGVRFSVNVVPEPSTYALGIAGTLVMGGAIARRKNRKPASA